MQKKMNEPKKRSFVWDIVDVIILIVLIYIMFSGAWLWVLTALILYSIFMVWKGWDYVKNLLDMVGLTYDKYKYVKEWKKNGRLKNKRRA